MSKSGNNFYYLQDELGSPMYMTGTDGVAIRAYALFIYGGSRSETSYWYIQFFKGYC